MICCDDFFVLDMYSSTPVSHWNNKHSSVATPVTATYTQSHKYEHSGAVEQYTTDVLNTPFRKLILQHVTPSGTGLRSGARRVVVTVAKEDERPSAVSHTPTRTQNVHKEKGNYMKPTEAYR